MIVLIGEYKIHEQSEAKDNPSTLTAIHLPTGTIYSVQQIFHDLNHSDSLDLIKKHLSRISKLDHIGIPKIHTVLETAESHFILFDHIEGDNLTTYLKQHGALNEDLARQYFRQLIQLISFLHSNNLPYNDLHLNNFIIDTKSQLKIINIPFSPIPDHPFDLQAIGLILDAMSTGILPSKSPTQISKSLSVDATDLLRQLLFANPTKRCTMREIRGHRWLHSEVDQGITAFDLIGRTSSLAKVVVSFSANCGRKLVIQKLFWTAELFRAEVFQGTDDYSLTMKCLLPRNERVMVKFQVLPIDENCVVITGRRLLGTDVWFRKVLRKAKELILPEK
jgi:serine/threonine protein kinase